MFCTSCGKKLPEGNRICPYCGKTQKRVNYQMQRQVVASSTRQGIDNIFSALVQENTPGAIMEFTLWCIVCFEVLLSLIASIIGKGNITWILMMVFSIGLAVLLAFRLKPIAMLYSVGVFNFLTVVVHYICFVKSSDYLWGYDEYSYSPLNIVLFVLLLLLSIAILTCAFIHFFSRVELGSVLTIMVIVDSSLAIILQILMYAAGFLDTDGSSINDYLREYLNYRGYWIGTVCLWIMLVVVTLFYIFFFWGFIDSRKGKIINNVGGTVNAGNRMAAVNPGIKGIKGVYAGRIIYLQGRAVTVGSDNQMMVIIKDPFVSGKHCAIRYNNLNGFYEIFDNSKNGVFLGNGMMLQKGVYNSVQRGTVINIGSEAQQFILL